MARRPVSGEPEMSCVNGAPVGAVDFAVAVTASRVGRCGSRSARVQPCREALWQRRRNGVEREPAGCPYQALTAELSVRRCRPSL